MTPERPKSPGARLFIALDLPDDLRKGIAVWGKRELSDPTLRLVPAEALHVTLAFLGYTSEKEIGRLGEVVAGLKAAAPTIQLGEPVAKPSLRRARLFALPVESPGAVSLQAELEERLIEERLHKPEKRAFWPHVTVARVRSAGHGSKRPRPAEKPPGPLPRALLQPFFPVVRVRLYRSELNPKGACYTPLAHVELSQGGRQ